MLYFLTVTHCHPTSSLPGRGPFREMPFSNVSILNQKLEVELRSESLHVLQFKHFGFKQKVIIIILIYFIFSNFKNGHCTGKNNKR